MSASRKRSGQAAQTGDKRMVAASGAEPADASRVLIVAHPPERRRGRATVPAQAGHCCCCCCCCCLHSLGAIIGAAMAPNLGAGPRPRSYLPLAYYWDEEDFESWTPPPRDREAIMAEASATGITPAEAVRGYEEAGRHSPREIALPASGPSAVLMFWWSVFALVIVGVFLSVALGGASGLMVGLVIILLVLPGMQLIAALIIAVVLAVSARRDQVYQLRQLGKITLGVVVGTVIGIVIMVLIYFVLTRR